MTARKPLPVDLIDALVGATAVSHGLPLLTGNHKHYKVMKEVQICTFVP